MRHSKFTKEAAVARIRANDVPLLELAREYGVSTNTLRAWLRENTMRARAQEDARHVVSSFAQHEDAQASQRERLMMHAMKYSPATIIITDAEGKIVYANPKFVETTGYAIEEVLGQTPRVLKSGNTSSDEYRQLWETIRGGREWRGTFHNRRKDGSLYWERASISPVLNDAGNITHFMAVKEDITDYMEADFERRKTASSFLAVIAALPSALLLVDALGRILLANEAAEATFDMALPQGTRLSKLNLRWLDAEGNALKEIEHPLQAILSGQTGSTVLRSRIGIVPPKGGVRWQEAIMRAVQLPHEQETAALLVFA